MKKGLSLGAGGVKGFVHLGVLQYLYEQEIKFDLVSGSSIGSIMGAMYALGFTPSKMMSECIKIGFSDVQKLIGYRFVKNGISGLIDQLLGGKSFEDTLIPFKAVAVYGRAKEFFYGEFRSRHRLFQRDSALFKTCKNRRRNVCGRSVYRFRSRRRSKRNGGG